jgi:hypothetical protein
LNVLNDVPSWVWTILIAIATTIVVEYAAKPRLEARKARLLRDRNQLDDLIFAFQGVGLRLGALVSTPIFVDELIQTVYESQLDELVDELASAIKALTRLSPWFAQRHADHIGKAAYFLSYIEGLARSARKGSSEADGLLRQHGAELEKFDVYFRVYVGLHDSVEPWWKRLFWRAFLRRDYEKASAEVVDEIRRRNLLSGS